MSKEDGIFDSKVDLKVRFAKKEIDIHELYELFSGRVSFSDLVEFSGKSTADVQINVFETIGFVLSGEFEKRALEEGLSVRKLAKTPYLDLLEKGLLEVLIKLYLKNNRTFFRKFFPFSVCLTHDVDEKKKTYQYFTKAYRDFLSGKILDSLKEIYGFFHDKFRRRNPYWTFSEIMRLEEEKSVRSTFFFLEETAKISLNPKTWKHFGRRYRFDDEEISEVMRKLVKGGWEVALHGSYNSFSNYDLLKGEKEKLERVLGEKIHGIRQHNLNFDFPETWEIQEMVGLSYDTSLGFKSYDGIGFKWGTCKPFKPFTRDGRAIDVLEIPLTLMDISIKNPKRNAEKVESLFKEVAKVDGIFCVLWHHVLFNSEDFSEWIELYERIIELGKSYEALFLTAKEVNDLWRKMVSSPLSVSCKEFRLSYHCDYPFVRAYTSLDVV